MQGKPHAAISTATRSAAAFLLATLWLLLGSARAQEYSFRNFAGSDGLGNLSIQKIYQDRSGFLWVGTENGIFRYNGDRFDPFGPAQGVPAVGGVAFGEAPDGALLIGASIGLYRLTSDRFAKIPTPFNTVTWTQGIQRDAQGITYLATDSGLWQMTLQPGAGTYNFRRLYPASGASPQTIYSVFLANGTIWFGCGLNLCKLDGARTKVFTAADGLLNVPLAAVIKDRAGNIWVRARNEGILEWPAGEPHFRRPDTPIPGSTLTGTPALDRDGHILLGTPDGLLIQKDQGWQFIDRQAGLRGGAFTTLEDRQHSLWMGTGGRGLTQWRGYREWESYTSASGLPSDNVYESLPQPDGSIWVGTEAGLVRGQPNGTGLVWKTIAGTTGLAVHSLQMTPTGDLWFSTASKGVARLHVSTGKLDWFGTAQGLSALSVFTIRFDRSSQLWAATNAGLFVASPPYQSFARIEAVPPSWFWTVTEGADGTLWAGGTDGLFALTSNHWQHWNQASGLSNQSIVSLGPAPDGSTWIGYQHGGGIDRIHLSPTGAAIQNALQRPGTDGLIYFLAFDRSGRLWAGTERGIDVWDGAFWTHYDTTDGLIWDDCDIGGFSQGPDGALWFGTSGGLSRFTPRPEQSPTPSPRVVFTSLRLGQADILGQNNPSLAMSSGALVAWFSAPNATQDSSRLFRYRLEGAKSPWTETPQRGLEFARLAPGSYTLEVQARDSRGVWSTQAAQFKFSIQPPWYASIWFTALLALIPFAGALIAFRIRTRGARKREQHLQQIVNEKTSDLRKANEELLKLTMIDALTGVANRRQFDRTLAQECERVKRSGSSLSLIMIDVDHFKSLNDSAGHQKGDEYLTLLGREFVRTARRRIDLIARIGGEEFALILPETEATEAAQMAEDLRSHIEALALPHSASSVAPSLTVSAGVATSTGDRFLSPEGLISAADQALYRAKNQGRNRVQSA